MNNPKIYTDAEELLKALLSEVLTTGTPKLTSFLIEGSDAVIRVWAGLGEASEPILRIDHLNEENKVLQEQLQFWKNLYKRDVIDANKNLKFLATKDFVAAMIISGRGNVDIKTCAAIADSVIKISQQDTPSIENEES